MKPFSKSLHKVLLLTSFLCTPSIALAQTTDPAPIPDEQSAEFGDDEFGDEGEIVVLGRNIPEPMRETSEVATFLTAEDLARQGDDTAAEALPRLAGLSLVSGRFVFVRGLGDRYSSALLNGSPLPSPEPLRRTVPLDLFPSNILAGATVQKTFSPNYPGEFGGGIIDLRTIATPLDPFLTLKVSGGVNTETTARRGLYYYGSETDWTGYDDGTRDIPGPLSAAIARGQLISDVNFTPDELEAIGESFVNSPLTVIQTGDIDPNFEFETTGGTSWQRGDVTFGLIGVAGYDSSWTTQRAQRGVGATSCAPTACEEKESVQSTWNVTLNALGGASVGWGENEIQLTGLYVHSTSKEAQISQGYDFNAIGNQLHTESTAWYERELTSLQLRGDHTFGPLDVDWRFAGARSTRNAPYERSISRQIGSDGVPFYGIGNANVTRFSELTDNVISGGVDLAYTFPLSGNRDAVISGGYAYSNTTRTYDQLQFVFGGSLNLVTEADVARARTDYLFSPDNIAPTRFEIFELTGPDDSYKGGLLVNAAYAAADVEILPLVRAAIGARWEDARQSVTTANRYGAPSTAPVELENSYVLPAATLTWNFAEDLQLRMGYSQTIARPQFRELAISPYVDPETDRNYRGNPGLVDSEIANYDARIEYYFGRNQFVTFGGFYKDIERPIEEVITETSLANFVTRFINAPQATVYGAEFEYRTTFDWDLFDSILGDPSWLFAFNYTYTQSEVQAGSGDTVINPLTGVPTPASAFALDGAQLQGTPENIANLQFGFDTGRTQMTLLVGWVDERILQRGFGAGLPDVIEDPGINVDLTYRHDFVAGGTDFTFGLSARNLLDIEHREYQSTSFGDVEVNTYDRGVSLSASLSARF